MQSCDELKDLVLRHYGKFAAGGQSDTIHEMYSLEDGVVIIGAEHDEWFADHASILKVIKQGSSVQVNIDVLDIEARSEGSVAWTMDRVLVTMPDGSTSPVRHTRIFHQEDGKWKMVHLHVSMAAFDEII